MIELNMDAFQIEAARQKLIHLFSKNYSSRRTLYFLYEYYQNLLASKDQFLIQAFLPEFLRQFSELIKLYNPFGLPPERTKSLLLQAEKITGFCTTEESRILMPAIQKINQQAEELEQILQGKTITCKNRLNIPLLEISAEKETVHSGLLETIHIEISAADEQRFILIPTMEITDQRLQQQITISWQLAYQYVQGYIRNLKAHHRVLIQFEQPGTHYSGDSMGVALAVGFIEPLFHFYNAAYRVRFQPEIATTGKIDEHGLITALGEKTIAEKVETVFYSPVSFFIIPQQDLPAAQNRLIDLRSKYPDRNLELIPVISLSDVLDRRRLITFNKTPLYLRSARLLSNIKISIILLLIIIATVTLYSLRLLDTNPAELIHHENDLIVKNRYGRSLWKLKQIYNPALQVFYWFNRSIHLLLDINNDGKNEVLISKESTEELTDNPEQQGRLLCYDYQKNIIWSYMFADTVSTIVEKHNTIYRSSFIDTVTLDGKLQLLCRATNHPYYPTAIYKLDPINGKRISGTFWHAGHIVEAIILRNNQSTKIICIGINNAFNRTVLVVLNPDSIDGQGPNTLNYHFKGIRPVTPEHYLFLPRSDVNRYYGWRNNFFESFTLSFDRFSNRITLHTIEHTSTAGIFIGYEIAPDFSDINIVLSSQFVFIRDQLIEEGKLELPYTETHEYHQILLNDFYKWDGSKMVPLKE